MLREASDHPLALNLLISLRPRQWTKNLLVFAGLLFGLRLFDLMAVGRAFAAFGIFCLLSGVVYLINDIADRDTDRQHPLKAQRPIASGALSVPDGADLCDRAGRRGRWRVRSRSACRFFIVAALYLALLALYSGPLKHIVIIDVLTIAVGFVLRAVAGAVAVDVDISHWLLVCTILLALFIALAKRRHELVLLADDAASHRPILGEYTPYLLDQMIAVVTASTLIAYMFYTISPETEQKFGTDVAGADDSVSALRHLPLLVSCAPARRRREPCRPAADRSPAARLRDAVGGGGGADHLPSHLTPLNMADFNVRSDSVNVEQIMEQIRARIREKRGVDYTEQQIRELAAVKLEKFLDPRGVRSDLLEQFRRSRRSPTAQFRIRGRHAVRFAPRAVSHVDSPIAAAGAEAVLQSEPADPRAAHAVAASTLSAKREPRTDRCTTR